VEKAVQLVLFRSIERGESGRVWWVGSETTPDTTYSVSHTSCSCRDWQVRGGPCGHQFAVDILTRLERLTADRDQADCLDVDCPIDLELTPEAYELLDQFGEPCAIEPARPVGTITVLSMSATAQALADELYGPDGAA
jgi:hypothetical protein